MGIFSFGKKSAGSSERNGGRSRAAGSEERARGRGRESGREAGREADGERFDRTASTRRSRTVGQEAMLDPTLPEKQRARRRLVGAIALVLAAVIILPMVLDSHPKPVTDDIAISIPERDRATAQAASPRAASGTDAQAGNPTDGVAPDAAPGTTDAGNIRTGNSGTDSRGASPSAVDSGTNANSNANTGVATVDAAAPAPARTQRQTGDNAAKASVPTPRAATTSAANATANLTAKVTGTPSRAVTPPSGAAAAGASPSTSSAALPPTPATPGSRYVVQLGTFESDAAAREWVGKLKNIGVPAYIEQARQPDGSNRVMLRAGPFADRSIAQAAVAKVRQAGLSQAGR